MAHLLAFWDWFQEYREAYYYLQDFSEAEQVFYYDALDSRLKDYHPNLTFVFVFAQEGEAAQLILTTNGQADGLFFVTNLVRIAPEIPKWKITAFIQPKLDLEAIKNGVDAPYYFKDLSIKPSDLRWAPVDLDVRTGTYDLQFHLITFPRLEMSADFDQVLDFIYIILLDLLGEVVVRQRLGAGYYEDALLYYLDWYGLDELPDFLEVRP